MIIAQYSGPKRKKGSSLSLLSGVTKVRCRYLKRRLLQTLVDNTSDSLSTEQALQYLAYQYQQAEVIEKTTLRNLAWITHESYFNVSTQNIHLIYIIVL